MERLNTRKTFSSTDFKLRSPKAMNNEQGSLNRAHVCIESRRTSGFSLKFFCKNAQEERSGQISSQSLYDQTVKSTLELLESAMRELPLGFHH